MVEVISGHSLDLDLNVDTFDDVFLPFPLVAMTREEKEHTLLWSNVKEEGEALSFSGMASLCGLVQILYNSAKKTERSKI